MRSLRIAYRNVLRGWRRTLLLGGAIAFGFFIFTLLNALTGGMVGTVSQNLSSSLGGHLYVSGSEVSEQGSEVSVVRDTGTLEAALGSLGGQVASYSARSSAQVGVIFGSREETAELVGVDFAQESGFLESLEFKAGSAEALVHNEAGIALPEALIEDLGIQVGESVVVRTTTITGQQNIGDFVVAGALAADEAFGPPGLAAQGYTHLGAMNILLGMEPGQYQSLNLYLDDLAGLETATTTLHSELGRTGVVEPRETGGGGLPNPADFLALGGLSSVDEDERWQGTKFRVTNLNDELDSVFTIVTLINRAGLIVFVVILVIIMVGITNSYRLVMTERTAEIGTMRALGVQREGVRNIFLWEALFIALGGTALGLALAATAMVGLGFVTFPADGAFGIFLNEGRFTFDLSLLTTISNIALVCLLSVAAVYLPARAAAQETDEDALFGGDSIVQENDQTGDESGTTDDSLFGGGELFTDVEETVGTDPSAALLEGGTTLGGDFDFSLEGALTIDPEGEVGFASGSADLNTRLFVDARPQRDFRVFADSDLGYSTATGRTFALDELFADVELGSVFVRAGKQTVNWGVGYFYSPANLINLGRIDPENPGAELSGPPALRAQLPLDNSNLTGYVLTDDFAEDLNLSAAARFETLLSGFEVTTGGIAKDSGAWAVMGTATGRIAGMTVFGEAVLEGNVDKVFVYEDECSPSGFGTTQSESLFFSGTLGGRYTFETDDERTSVTATAQYFFNGKGYEDPGLFTDNPAAVAGFVGSGELRPDDLAERGQHYLGFNVVAPEVDESDFTPTALWLANLGDGSGLVNARLNYALNDFLTPRLEYRFRYGAAGSEYNPGGERHSLTVGLEVSGAF